MTLHVGRFASPDRAILGVRELVRDDLSALREKRKAPAVGRFKDSHHRMARLFATGMRHKQVAAQCGYSLIRVQTIHPDPAFQELIAHYRKEVTAAFAEAVDDYYEVATSNMLKAERMLADKLDQADEADETLPTRELISISRDAADRFGYGKRQTNLNVNVDFAAQLEKAIKRSGKTIDGGPSPLPRQVEARLAPSSRTQQQVEPPQLIRRRV